jgi:hypothetical protein
MRAPEAMAFGLIAAAPVKVGYTRQASAAIRCHASGGG